MSTTDFIQHSMRAAHDFGRMLFRDMSNAPLVRPVPDRGNHAYWLLGHVVVSEASLLDDYIFENPNRYAAWMDQFKGGSTPGDNMNGGPSYDELLAAYDDVHAAAIDYVAGLSDADLAKPCCKPGGPGPQFDTIAECLSAVISHKMFHVGQVADARRADERSPLAF